MDLPLVSVITVVRNGQRFLPAALASLQAQAYRRLDIIVVDGKSTDKTAELAMGIPGVRYIYQRDLGLANARNLGIRASAGKFIAFLDADDTWAPAKLHAQVSHLVTHPELQGVVASLQFVVEPEYAVQQGAETAYDHGDVIGYTPGALLARKGVFSEVGLFDPAYSIACDADWFARALDRKTSLAVLPEVMLYKRIHGGNISLDLARARKETMLMLHHSLLRKRNARGTNA